MLDRIRPSVNASTNNPNAYDLIFVGSGLSGTLTLIQVLEELRNVWPAVNALRPSRAWRIAVADAWGDFGRGVPYGCSVHPMLLLNNDVAAMDVRGFHGWLAANRNRWLGMLRAHPSAAVASWLQFNRAALAASESEAQHYLPLFLPRCVFGLFMSDILADALLTQEGDRSASVELLQCEVMSLARLGNSFRLGLRDGAPLNAGIVVLALGSLGPDPSPHLEGAPGYVHNVNPPSGAPLHSMLSVLSANIPKPSRAAITGSHASAMEAIYTIAHHHSLNQIISEVVVISPSGRLPDANSSGIEPPFEPRALNCLFTRPPASADEVIAAALRDVDQARKFGYSSIDYSPSLCSAFNRIFGCLSANEKRRFVEEFGMQFTALNRHAPPEYAAAARKLLHEGRLRLIAAEVTDVDPPNAATPRFTITFSPASGSFKQLRAAAVINCRGSGTLAHARDPLLRDILRPDSDIAQPNRCGKGIAVSVDFEASPSVFVAGPLLAGHSCGSDHLWNLERAERLDWMAQRIAPAIAARLANDAPTLPNNARIRLHR
jgi:uncharacterized NAD(P)/FAD-binding protein YdhS